MPFLRAQFEFWGLNRGRMRNLMKLLISVMQTSSISIPCSINCPENANFVHFKSEIWILGLESKPYEKIEYVLELSDLKKPYYDISFNFPSKVNSAHIKSETVNLGTQIRVGWNSIEFSRSVPNKTHILIIFFSQQPSTFLFISYHFKIKTGNISTIF